MFARSSTLSGPLRSSFAQLYSGVSPSMFSSGVAGSRFASGITFHPLTYSMGAEIEGVDLSNFNKDEFEQIQQGLLKYGVIFFRDQNMSQEDHLNLARHFGTPEAHPIVKGLPDYPDILEVVKEANAVTRFGEEWHTDNAYQARPTGESILIGRQVPTYGNDTVWAGMHLIYDSLSDGLKETLGNLRAIHSAARAFSVTGDRLENFKKDTENALKYQESESLYAESSHPVVRTHPISGKKALFVNKMFTLRFDGWTEEESLPLLSYLDNLPNRPEVQCRFRWRQNSVAIWDNRICQHIAIGDGGDKRRVMQRITVAGEVPV